MFRSAVAIGVLSAVSTFGGLVVAPSGTAATEGTGAADLGPFYLGGSAYTSQTFIPAAMLASIPNGNVINAIGFRLDSSAVTGPSSTLNWTNFDIVLSAPSATYSSSLGTLFSSNIGADAVTVRSGPLSIAANSYTGGGSPNAFGPLITFTTPYTYTGGNLLITIRHTGSGGDSLVLDIGANSLGTESYAGAGYTATSGNSSIGRIAVTELQFDTPGAAVPEPGTVSLFLFGGGVLWIARRRRLA